MEPLISKVYAGIGVNGTSVGINSVGGGNSSLDFDTLFANINDQILTPIIYLLFALAMIYFLWGVFEFVKNADSAEKRADGYKHMIWGIIGIFIMVSAKGIINLILSSIGLS
jgi:uncharacterized membrane protein YidH (DUF202 family)